MDNQSYEKKKGNPITPKGKNNIKQVVLKNIKLIFLLSLAISIFAGGVYIGPKVFGKQENKVNIITTSTLEKIIDISELSTFQAIYNGIAVVMNEKEPAIVDYYVSYEAKVNAGFDFKKVKVLLDEESKIITVNLPKIEINDFNVDIGSLDYIFQNDKANVSSVSAQAYRECITDVENESKKESAISELAEQNAINIMKALISPFVEQLDSSYKVVVNSEGAR